MPWAEEGVEGRIRAGFRKHRHAGFVLHCNTHCAIIMRFHVLASFYEQMWCDCYLWHLIIQNRQIIFKNNNFKLPTLKNDRNYVSSRETIMLSTCPQTYTNSKNQVLNHAWGFFFVPSFFSFLFFRRKTYRLNLIYHEGKPLKKSFLNFVLICNICILLIFTF